MNHPVHALHRQFQSIAVAYIADEPAQPHIILELLSHLRLRKLSARINANPLAAIFEQFPHEAARQETRAARNQHAHAFRLRHLETALITGERKRSVHLWEIWKMAI